MQLQTVMRGDTVVLLVEGELDLSTCELLEQRLKDLEASDSSSVIVDIDGVTFMDSSGLHVLIAHLGSNGDGADGVAPRIRLTRGSRQVRRMFELVGVANHLPFVS